MVQAQPASREHAPGEHADRLGNGDIAISGEAQFRIGPRPPALPVPTSLHWDEWIGPAPYRDYHTDLHPHEWHGWYDFGNGSLGNMGCHVLDGVFWALKIERPAAIEAEEIRDNALYVSGLLVEKMGGRSGHHRRQP